MKLVFYWNIRKFHLIYQITNYVSEALARVERIAGLENKSQVQKGATFPFNFWPGLAICFVLDFAEALKKDFREDSLQLLTVPYGSVR